MLAAPRELRRPPALAARVFLAGHRSPRPACSPTPAVGRALADAGFVAHARRPVGAGGIAGDPVALRRARRAGQLAARSAAGTRGRRALRGAATRHLRRPAAGIATRPVRNVPRQTAGSSAPAGLLDGLTDLGRRHPTRPRTAPSLKKQLDQEIRGPDRIRPPAPRGRRPAGGPSGPRVRPDPARPPGRSRGRACPARRDDANAALVLAAAYRDQQRWDEAEAMSARAVRLLGPSGDRDLLATAYDGWAGGRPQRRPACGRRTRLARSTRPTSGPGRLLPPAARPPLPRRRPAAPGPRPPARSPPARPGRPRQTRQDVIDSIRRGTPACVLR